jgi:hypothetical protein
LDEIKPEKKNIFIIALRWIFGILFLMAGFGDILKLSLLAGLIYLLVGIISIPPTASSLEKKLNFKMSGTARFIVVFVLLMAGSAASPHIDTSVGVNNSTNAIAAPPSSVSGSDAIAVPSEPTHVTTPTPTPTPEVTETPAVTKTSESMPEVTETSEVTSVVAPEETPTTEATPEVTSTPTLTSKPTPTSTPTPEITPTKITDTGGTVYASSESNKYHSAGCRYVPKIKPEHLITFKSREEAEAEGYTACKICGG